MLSIPPATTTSLIPNWILCAARIVAAKRGYDDNISTNCFFNIINKELLQVSRTPFIPDAQTLLIAEQTTVFGIPAPKAACLAGACPKLALNTLPK